MTSSRTIKITFFRNQISFEGMSCFPDDGNSQLWTKAASLAWDLAATQALQDRCGNAESQSSVRYGRDGALHGPFVTVKVDDGEDVYEEEPTKEELAWAKEITEAADFAGWEAAQEARI